MTINLTLDEEQLGILLNQIESMFEGSLLGNDRSEETLCSEIESAAARWAPDGDNAFAYQIVKVAPVYRQLLAHWTKPEGIAGVYQADDLFDFMNALRGARSGGAR